MVAPSVVRRSARSRHALARLAAVLLLVSAGLASLGACSGGARRPRDVAGDRRPRGRVADASAEAGDPGIAPEPPPPVVQPVVKANKPRVVAHASTRALALDATSIYYGDSEDDGIYALPKAGGDPVRLARHAPVAGAIALDTDTVSWIGSPGDAVLRVPLHGGAQPTTLRDRGIFSDVATFGGDVFIAEAVGSGGALWRVTGTTPTATRIAGLDAAPRAIMVDATHVYVITKSGIVRTPYPKAQVETLAAGTAFGSAEMDDTSIYVVAAADKSRVVAKLAKTGGALTPLATGVRDGPLEVLGDEVLYLDATRPALRAVPKGGGPSRLVAEDGTLAGATAIEADGRTIYVAIGSAENGVIVAVDGAK
jgi:hypothetical protein